MDFGTHRVSNPPGDTEDICIMLVTLSTLKKNKTRMGTREQWEVAFQVESSKKASLVDDIGAKPESSEGVRWWIYIRGQKERQDLNT